MTVLLIAGICIVLGGLAAIGFGIPVHEFSFGNTLILAGTVGASAGAILVGLSVVVRELKGALQQPGLLNFRGATIPQSDSHSPMDVGMNKRAGTDEFSLGDRPVPNVSDADLAAQPSLPEQLDLKVPVEEDVPETVLPAKSRRNLLFASSSRKERERAAAKNPGAVEGEIADVAPDVPPVQRPAAPPPSFDDAWPPSERGRAEEAIPPRVRTPSTFNAPSNVAPVPERYAPPRAPDQPPVTVLKSGIVDGMAYSLYSDGSIEAQMPEGMMRFASIDELRSHLDQRP